LEVGSTIIVLPSVCKVTVLATEGLVVTLALLMVVGSIARDIVRLIVLQELRWQYLQGLRILFEMLVPLKNILLGFLFRLYSFYYGLDNNKLIKKMYDINNIPNVKVERLPKIRREMLKD
jgi:hypothetical protein